MADLSKALSAASSAINIEISALSKFAEKLESNLKPALEIILASQGHVVITGLGKSGLVGAKIAATLASTGTPSFFMHSGDALHGDSGALTPGDVLIAISNSGETAEVCAIAKMAKGWGNPTIAITKSANSTLAKGCDAVIDISFEKEEPTGNSIFFLGITSGTTGAPKISMLSHLNIVCGQAADRYLGYNFNKDDVYLSYVPLTHI